MENKRKRHQESYVQTTPSPSEIGLGDSEVLVTPQNQHKDKKLKKCKKAPKDLDDDYKLKKQKKHKKHKKLLDKLSNRLNEMTEIVKKLQKNSDLLEISLKEKETPEKMVVERDCCFESKDAFIQHQKSIFVQGFDCSFPKDDIKSALIKHFSSCGVVVGVNIPFHCTTGSPLGFAFINMRQDEDKALTLNGSYLGGLRLEVTMAVERDEYDGYTDHDGCDRCNTVLTNRRLRSFYGDRFRFRFTPTTDSAVPSKKQ